MRPTARRDTADRKSNCLQQRLAAGSQPKLANNNIALGDTMKILIVTWYFPPYNSMGSLRCGNFARYLLSQGHDVKILSAKDQPYPKTLPIDFPDERVIRTRHIYVNAFPDHVHGWISALKSIFVGGPKNSQESTTATVTAAGETPSSCAAST